MRADEEGSGRGVTNHENFNKKDFLVGRIAQELDGAGIREANLVEIFARNLTGDKPHHIWADTIGRTLSVLCRISDEALVERVYRFAKYIYIHRDVT